MKRLLFYQETLLFFVAGLLLLATALLFLEGPSSHSNPLIAPLGQEDGGFVRHSP